MHGNIKENQSQRQIDRLKKMTNNLASVSAAESRSQA